MKQLYKYTGTLSNSSYSKVSDEALSHTDLVLKNWREPKEPPCRLEAVGGIADYIKDLHYTDAEEKYTLCDYYYDELLMIQRIEVPSSKPGIPAKIIAMKHFLAEEVDIFGSMDYIEDENPAPMSQAELNRWYRYQYENR